MMLTYPTVSPQVGTVSPSHMKLPTNAQMAEIRRVAGMNTDVAIMTGRTNTRRSRMCVYAAIALENVRIVSIGTVCNRVVYGRVTGGGLTGIRDTKRRTMEKSTQKERPAHQIAVHIESWYFLRPLGMCRGSGSENTSRGLEWPSRGSREAVSDKDIGSLLVEGGGSGGEWTRMVSGPKRFEGGTESSVDTEGTGESDRDRDRECLMRGDAK